jgi:hypothetical protein
MGRKNQWTFWRSGQRKIQVHDGVEEPRHGPPHVSKDSCKGPENYDCNHSDLLYIYPDGPEQSLKAIYFDNEGHIIEYSVSTPTPTTAVFLSDSSQPGPQFRLLYERKADTMSGKFQIRIPRFRANGSPTSNGVGKRIKDENAKQVVQNPKSSTNRIWASALTKSDPPVLRRSDPEQERRMDIQ